MTHWTDKQGIRRLGAIGYDATRAKEYYRSSFPNSSPKFFKFNADGLKAHKNGAIRPLIPGEVARPVGKPTIVALIKLQSRTTLPSPASPWHDLSRAAAVRDYGFGVPGLAESVAFCKRS